MVYIQELKMLKIIPIILLALAAGCASYTNTVPADRPESREAAVDISAPCRNDDIYLVKPGDTLMKIARGVYGDASRWRSIYNANRERLRSPHDLKPGMKLLLLPKDLPYAIEYTVREGDTLSKIALEFYGDAACAKIIAEENALPDPDMLTPGQVLKIPVLK